MLATEPQAHPGNPCRIGIALRSLAPEDAAALSDVLADASVDAARLARVLPKWPALGEAVNAQAIRRHRRGDCLCPRT